MNVDSMKSEKYALSITREPEENHGKKSGQSENWLRLKLNLYNYINLSGSHENVCNVLMRLKSTQFLWQLPMGLSRFGFCSYGLKCVSKNVLGISMLLSFTEPFRVSNGYITVTLLSLLHVLHRMEYIDKISSAQTNSFLSPSVTSGTSSW